MYFERKCIMRKVSQFRHTRFYVHWFSVIVLALGGSILIMVNIGHLGVETVVKCDQIDCVKHR